jgi:hypothetical protein
VGELTFLQESGYCQFTPDRLFDLQYFELGQRTVRSCTHCQFLFNDASVMQRESFIVELLLSNKYRPDLADKALDFYEMGEDDDEARMRGIIRSKNHRNYWAAKFESQSLEKRQAWTKTNWTTVTEDILIGRKSNAVTLGD